jgi:hypothetical protein
MANHEDLLAICVAFGCYASTYWQACWQRCVLAGVVMVALLFGYFWIVGWNVHYLKEVCE